MTRRRSWETLLAMGLGLGLVVMTWLYLFERGSAAYWRDRYAVAKQRLEAATAKSVTR